MSASEQIPEVEEVEEVEEKRATESLMSALLAVQSEVPTLSKKTENPHFKSKFASLDYVMSEISPILNRHGLVWLTLPGRVEGEPVLVYRLVHAASGEALEGSMPLMLKTADPQGQGSALTYARRYSIMAVLGLVANEDDDGNHAHRAALREPFGPAAAPEIATSARKAIAWMFGNTAAINSKPITEVLEDIERRAAGYLPEIAARAIGHAASAARANQGMWADRANQGMWADRANQGVRAAEGLPPGEGDPAVETEDERLEREAAEAIAAEHGGTDAA